MTRTMNEQLVHWLSDLYSVEQQALAQMSSAPQAADDEQLADVFRVHQQETETHASQVGKRLRDLGQSPSAIKDAIMKIGGKGFLLFALVQPETPGRLVAHSYAYEAMEWAGYDMLARFARTIGDDQTGELAVKIAAQERAMMDRLERGFDAAEEASHGETPLDDLPDQIRKHLSESHALEIQSVELLKKSQSLAGSQELRDLYTLHLEQTHEHVHLIERQLTTMNADPSAIKDAAMKLGALNWGLFFQAQSDTPAKLAAFAYGVEHLEIAGYELLTRTANRIGDADTQQLCQQILGEERDMADRLANAFEGAVHATFETVAQ